MVLVAAIPRDLWVAAAICAVACADLDTGRALDLAQTAARVAEAATTFGPREDLTLPTTAAVSQSSLGHLYSDFARLIDQVTAGSEAVNAIEGASWESGQFKVTVERGVDRADPLAYCVPNPQVREEGEPWSLQVTDASSAEVRFKVLAIWGRRGWEGGMDANHAASGRFDRACFTHGAYWTFRGSSWVRQEDSIGTEGLFFPHFEATHTTDRDEFVETLVEGDIPRGIFELRTSRQGAGAAVQASDVPPPAVRRLECWGAPDPVVLEELERPLPGAEGGCPEWVRGF